jgi:WD40 repeat protein
MNYAAVEALVAGDEIAGAIAHIETTGDANASRWLDFLQAAAFAVDRQSTVAGRSLSLRQLAFDDESAAIASEAREHAREHGSPPLYLVDSSRQRRTSDAEVLTVHQRDVRYLAVADSSLVVTAGRDGSVTTVHAPSGEVVSTAELGRARGIVHLDAAQVAVARANGAVAVLDCRSGQIEVEVECPTGSGISSMARVGKACVATGHVDGSLFIHDLATGRSSTSSHHKAPVRAIVPIRPGLLACGSYDGVVSLSDIDAQPLALLDRHRDPIRAIASDGRILCSADDGGLTLIWDLDSHSLRASNQGPTRGVHHLLLLTAGTLIAGDFDGTLRAIDLASGDDLVRRRSHTARIRTLTRLADGQILTASDDRSIRTWSPDDLRETSRRTGHLGWVRNAAPLADGRLVSSSIDKTVRVWPRRDGAAHTTGHTGWIRALAACGSLIASAAEDGTVRLWQPTEGRCTDTSEATDGHTRCLASAGLSVVAGGDDGALAAWRVEGERLVGRRSLIGAHDRVRGVAMLDHDLAVSAGADGWLRLWELPSLKCIAAWHDADAGGWRTLARVNATTVAGGTERGELVIWNVETSESRRLKGHRGRIWTTTVLSEDSILTVSFDRTARLWDLPSSTEHLQVGEPLGASWGVCSVGASHIAAATPIGVVRIAAAGDLSVQGRADLRSAAVSLVAVEANDGRWHLAVGGDDPCPLFLVVDSAVGVRSANGGSGDERSGRCATRARAGLHSNVPEGTSE